MVHIFIWTKQTHNKIISNISGVHKMTKNTNLANFLIKVFFHKKYQITIFIYLYICIWFDVENIGCIWMKLIYHPLYFVLLHYLWQNKIRFLLWLTVNLDDLYFHALIKKKNKKQTSIPVSCSIFDPIAITLCL